MHVCVGVPAHDEEPRQKYCDRSGSVDTVKNETENVEKNRNLKLVGNIVGNFDDILGPYPIIQARFFTINPAGFSCLGLSRTENAKHHQREKNLCQNRPKSMTRTPLGLLIICAQRRQHARLRNGGEAAMEYPSPCLALLAQFAVLASKSLGM